MDGTEVDAICVRETSYIPASYMWISLERYLTPAESCSFLRGAMVNKNAKVDFRSIID